ncbi:reverse transcriptase domain-containing protein [Tanacetum coccineum]
MHVFVGNFTYIVDFMIVEDISSITDPRLSQVVLGKPFVEISNMTYDSLEGIVRFTNRIEEVTYKMPHMIEQYNSLSDLEKEHAKSVYLRNEKDKRRGVELFEVTTDEVNPILPFVFEDGLNGEDDEQRRRYGWTSSKPPLDGGLLQAPTDGVGDAIVVPPILANQFELKIGLLNLVTAIAFHGFENDDPHSHIRRFTKITQTVKLNNVSGDVVKLLLFLFSLEGAAQTWLEKKPPNSITTWNDHVFKFVNRLFPPSKTTNLRNEITRFQQRFSETFFEAWDRFKDLLNKCPHHGFSTLYQIDTFYNSLNQYEQDSLNSAANGNFLTKNTQEALTIIENKSKVQTSRNKPQVASASGSSTQDAHVTALTKQVEALLSSFNRPINSVQNSCETCGGPHAYYKCQAASGYTQEDVYATTGTYNAGGNSYQPQVLHERPQGALPSNTEPNLREQVNSIMTRSGLTTAEPSIPPPVPPTPRVEVEKELETLMDEQLHFGISLIDALTQIPKFTKVLKDLLRNKEKLEELANTLINAECSAILLNKVPEKLEDPRKFLIPCILQDLELCNSLADSGAIINLMPLSIYEKLEIGPLKPTRMTLELANRSVTFPMGIAEDVTVKVEKFNFLADFVIVDFEADPRVPIILGRPFLRAARSRVDLYGEKLTLRVGNEEVVFYTDKSLRNNSSDIQSVHCINIIDFSRDKPISGSSTFPSNSSPSSPLVETSDSLLEEFADKLALLDPFSPGNEDDNFDPEADLREIEYLLKRDPFTVSSPTTDIDIIDPILKRFTDEPALFYSSPQGDDDLFDLKSDNNKWKKLLYGNSYNDTPSENDKTKDSNTKSLIDKHESSVLLP